MASEGIHPKGILYYRSRPTSKSSKMRIRTQETFTVVKQEPVYRDAATTFNSVVKRDEISDEILKQLKMCPTMS